MAVLWRARLLGLACDKERSGRRSSVHNIPPPSLPPHYRLQTTTAIASPTALSLASPPLLLMALPWEYFTNGFNRKKI